MLKYNILSFLSQTQFERHVTQNVSHSCHEVLVSQEAVCVFLSFSSEMCNIGNATTSFIMFLH